VTYTYDMFDRRIAKSFDADGPGLNSAVVERYVYDGEQIALTFSGAGSLTHRYVYGPGNQILTDTNGTGVTQWALTDNIGSVRFLASSTGAVGAQLIYDSFGQTSTASTFLFGFAGMAIDRDSGLQFDGTNYYSPRIGRYIRQNAFSFGLGDVNRYRFQGNNPLENIEG
jgi:RHS repeat-associated protein